MSDDQPIPEDPFAEQEYETIEGEVEQPPASLAVVESHDIDIPPAPQQSLAELILGYRDITGWTQAELWREYDINEGNLSEIENGHIKRPQPSTLRRLADAFASRIEGANASRIYQRLMAARDNKPMEPMPLPELTIIGDRMGRYPTWYQRIVGKALLELSRHFEELYKKMR